MEKKNSKLCTSILVFLVFFVGISLYCLWGCDSIYYLFYDIQKSDGIKIDTWSINLLVMGLLITFSGLMGYYLSKKKRKNRLKWVVLCVLFNIWSLVILWLLPESKNKSKT